MHLPPAKPEHQNVVSAPERVNCHQNIGSSPVLPDGVDQLKSTKWRDK